MSRIENNYLNICNLSYKINPSDLYVNSCPTSGSETFSAPQFLSYNEYVDAKNRALAHIDRYFIKDIDIAPEKKFEGYLIAWLLQREVGYEDKAMFSFGSKKLSLKEIINDAMSFFTSSECNYSPKCLAKKKYWQIRMALILLDNIDSPYVQEFFKNYKSFFDLRVTIDSDPLMRKENILTILNSLMTKAQNYSDPMLIAEINLKRGIILKEQSNYEEANKCFKAAAENAKEVIEKIDNYKRTFIDNRVDNVENPATGETFSTYFRVAEKYHALSNAQKIIAQAILLSSYNGQEASLNDLNTALENVKEAENDLLRPNPEEYISIGELKGNVYKYYGEIYSMLDLELLRANIEIRIGLLLKDSCPESSKEHIKEADKILESIIQWKENYISDRSEAEKKVGHEWKLHPLIEGKGISLLSQWGASIVGNAYLAKARLLMAEHPDPNDPKAKLKDAKKYLDEAEQYLVKKDDHNFLSAKAEYWTRMYIEASPKELLPKLEEAKKILEKLPPGFIYARLWLPRIYMKEEKFEEAEKFLVGILKDKDYKPSFITEEKVKEILTDPTIPDFGPILTPQLKSSIYQTLAELALENDDLALAQELFTKSICWYPYNFYAQIGLADLYNWRKEFEEAEKFYQSVENNSYVPSNVKKRAELGLAEVALRKKTLNRKGATQEADQVIALSLKILEDSEELFMLERALESLGEALIAKKRGGLKGLEDLKANLLDTKFNIEKLLEKLDLHHYLDDPSPLKNLGKKTKLSNPMIRDRIKASLYLKVADGFLFIDEVEKAKQTLAEFEKWLGIEKSEKEDFSRWLEQKVKAHKLFQKKPLLMAHYLLTSAEIEQRQNTYDEKDIKKTREAARIIFSLPEEKKDPYLSERITSLINMEQNILEPHIKLNYHHFADKQSSENRWEFTLQLPLKGDQLTFYLTNFTDTRRDSQGYSILNTPYLGVKVKPEWAFKKHLTLDIKGKIPYSSRFLNQGTALPQYFRRPDLSGSLIGWWKYLTTVISGDLNFEELRLSTLYANIMANVGGWTKDPWLQLRVGPVFNFYHFTHFGDYRRRIFVGIGLNYEYDLAEVIKKLNYNQVKLRVETTIPLWEQEREPKHDYIKYSKVENRSILDGEVPWQGNVSVEIGLGRFGVIEIYGGATYQNTHLYDYWNWRGGVLYHINLFP